MPSVSCFIKSFISIFFGEILESATERFSLTKLHKVTNVRQLMCMKRDKEFTQE